MKLMQSKLKRLFLHFTFILGSYMAMADPGNGIVTDSKGNIYYSDLEKVWKIDAEGNKTVAVPNVHTHELYMDKNDNLFGEHLWYNGEAANTWGHYVWKLDAAGRLEKVIKDTAGFLEWYSFVRDDSGNMYYAENSIPITFWKISPDGKRTSLGSIGFRYIISMHYHKGILFFFNQDDLYTIREGDSIQLFRSNLYDPAKAEKPGEKCDRCIESVWTDKDDNIYVAVWGNGVVRKIDGNGTITTVHNSEKEWHPSGGVFDRNNSLWVLEYSNKNEVRVVKAGMHGGGQNKKDIKANKSSFSWLLMAGIIFVVTVVISLFVKNRKKVS